MSRARGGGGWHIFKDITWDAGLVVRRAFRGLHKPRKKKPVEHVREVKFVYKGQYFRRPIRPRTTSEPPQLMKIPPAGPQVVPQPFKTPPPDKLSTASLVAAASKPSAGSGGGPRRPPINSWSWRSWWKLNAPLVILNFGSLATLVGFTRSDVLELRSLAMTGNTAFVVYSLLQPPPIRWAAVCWSTLFASVNGYNIARILNERQGKVHLTPHEEEIYHEHFQPHGVTPKQFEKVMSTGKIQTIKKGDVLSLQGDQMSSVKLVVRGDTRANIMGRHLTAMGSVRGNRYSLQGGDSGAWVGEMAFLQSMWDRDHAPKKNLSLQKKTPGQDSSGSEKDAKTDPMPGGVGATLIRSGLPAGDEPYKYCAISTIVAVEDIEVIEWSFEEMEEVMKSSRDIQDALTRAMTAAIVGKVVNFMVSRQSVIPKWSTLLDNWKHASPRYRKDGGDSEVEDEDDDEMADEASKLLIQTIATSPPTTLAARVWRPFL